MNSARTTKLGNSLKTDVEEFATRGLCALAVTYKDSEVDGYAFDGEVTISSSSVSLSLNPLDAMALGVTGRRLGLGDHMYPAKVFKDKPSRFRVHLAQ